MVLQASRRDQVSRRVFFGEHGQDLCLVVCSVGGSLGDADIVSGVLTIYDMDGCNVLFPLVPTPFLVNGAPSLGM